MSSSDRRRLSGTGAVRTMLRALFVGLAVTALACAGAGAHGEPVTALAFSPDGTALISNGPGGLQIRSPADGTVRGEIRCPLKKVTSVAFHPSGKWLAVGGGVPGAQGEVLVLDWRSEEVLHRLTNWSDLVTSVAWSADGSRLGAAGANQIATIWRAGGEPLQLEGEQVLKGHSGPVLAIAFSPKGDVVATASADRSLKVWSVAEGRLLRSLSHHMEAVHALAFRPVGSSGGGGLVYCASGSDDRTVRVWQPEIGRMVRIVRDHGGAIFALGYSADGKLLFSAGREGIVRRIDADSDAILGQWDTGLDWIYALAVSPDGSKLAAGDWAGTVRVWKLAASENH